MSRFAPIQIQSEEEQLRATGQYRYGWKDEQYQYAFRAPKGLTEAVVRDISRRKKEPKWVLEYRLQGLRQFLAKPMPPWGADLSQIDFDEIYYYLQPTKKASRRWQDVPQDIKRTFERLGIPEAERKYLAGVKSQYDSQVIYGSLRKQLAKQGVIFLGMDEGLRQHPEMVKEYFGTVIPVGDNKFAALNTAVWSGGSFIYVPKGIEVELPLQAYFRINSPNAGQFERTLIIVDQGAKIHYIEGCSAPEYTDNSLHSAVVEIIVKPGARCQYTTIQNWYTNVYNLVTKRARVERDAKMFWVDGNLGCLSGSSLVSTPFGYKRIDEIRQGDEVYTFDFNLLKPVRMPVKAQRLTGTRQIFRLTTNDYRTIEATDNHPFLKLHRRNGFAIYEQTWTPLIDLKAGDTIAILSAYPDDGKPKKIDFNPDRKWMRNIPKLPKETNEDLMWLLGAYLGDGCLELDSKNKSKVRRVNFAIPKGDKAHPRINKILKGYGLNWSQLIVTKRINSTYLGQLIKELGFVGTAKTKAIPEWVFGLPRKQKLAFVEGYLDTDGHVRKKKIVSGKLYGQLTFTCVSRQLLEQMKLLMISCGLEPRGISTFLKERRLYRGILKEYTTNYMTMNINRNLELIRNKLFTETYYRFVKIRSIDKIDKAKVYDLEISGHHNFIANGIIVHNSKITMKYPSCFLVGQRAHGEILSVAFAGKGQVLDAGGKIVHLAPHTTGRIISKSVSKDGGRTAYRGLIQAVPAAVNSRSKVVCDALILDSQSRSDTYPTNTVMAHDFSLEHEATVSKIGEEQLFYLMSRGLSEEQASALIVSGFIEPIIKELPMEYAVELNRLVELEMEGSVG